MSTTGDDGEYTYDQYIEEILLDKPRLDQYEGSKNPEALFLAAWMTWEQDVRVCIEKLKEAIGVRRTNEYHGR